MLGIQCLTQWALSWWQYVLSIFYQKELNIVIVGLQNSGKTSLTDALTSKPFEQDTIPTLGMRMEHFHLGLNTVRVFDLAGQDRFQHMWKRYFARADLLIYVIDLSDSTNWPQVKQNLHQVICDTNRDSIPMLIVGNKIDLLIALESGSTISGRKLPKKTAADQNALEQWKYMAPLLRNYEYDDIPTYSLDETNLYVLRNVETLSKELGLDLKNGILHMPESQIYLDRDLAVFTISCKNGDYVRDIIDWIVQL
ncbi:LANO_0H11210g1_1 [Lachancea nothofagi CBS 11611]|uniref:LANO_0H11210g1_1 n=1 Tax=Lachancea nothofagi CBS 11611 TaxID=1266666 RepID=A0A1G4KM66_9SACH|nr:LANO_0H11210g1_1 [Lachancea nothofagi CBS 11611]